MPYFILMTPIATPEEHSLQLDLAKSKQQAREQKFDDPPFVDVTPKWLNELEGTLDNDPNVRLVLGNLLALIQKIPDVALATSKIAKDNYFKVLIAELARVYAARINIVVMDKKLTETQKQQSIEALILERNVRIVEMAKLLGSYKVDSTSKSL